MARTTVCIPNEIYDSVGQYDVPTLAEERQLCRQIETDVTAHQRALADLQEGQPEPRLDSPALHELVLRNLRLAIKFSAKASGRGVDSEDLFQEAAMGLIKAAKLFDLSVGVRFSTYAVWWIKQFTLRYVSNNSATVRLPNHIYQRLAKYRRMKQEWLSKRCRLPTRAEVLKRLECRGKDYYQILLLDGQGTVTIDSRDEDQNPLSETVAHPAGDLTFTDICKNEDAAYLTDLLRFLPRKLQTVLEMRYGFNGQRSSTLREVGDILGVTRERVRQMELLALESLRSAAARTPRGARELTASV